jgi:ABC-type Na+ efflux pump permease subunit
MHSLRVVLAKEWKCFSGSDLGLFILYLFLVLVWSLLLVLNVKSDSSAGSSWFIFFSVVVTANFSNSVFISERVNGVLDIFITSGLSRNAILYGKMLFAFSMVLLIGAICAILTWVLSFTVMDYHGKVIGYLDYLIYACATFLNISSSAYLSVKMNNTRLLHFANIFLLAVIIIIYKLIDSYWGASLLYLSLILLLFGIFFCWRAQKLYNSEKVLQTIFV